MHDNSTADFADQEAPAEGNDLGANTSDYVAEREEFDRDAAASNDDREIDEEAGEFYDDLNDLDDLSDLSPLDDDDEELQVERTDTEDAHRDTGDPNTDREYLQDMPPAQVNEDAVERN
ncbi:hypothetical protein [Microbacterium sp. YY-01]|uniref:hypothetical protein n=1 Tax=Microbacterium sp. YY-01 TaxID=3421634 RepID=UPI003D1727C8